MEKCQARRVRKNIPGAIEMGSLFLLFFSLSLCLWLSLPPSLSVSLSLSLCLSLPLSLSLFFPFLLLKGKNEPDQTKKVWSGAGGTGNQSQKMTIALGGGSMENIVKPMEMFGFSSMIFRSGIEI